MQVDVGGYRLYFKVVDGKAPTVVLEAGGGLDSSSWEAVQQPLAQATGSRVISYDRAGHGSSDAPTYGSYDLVQEVETLQRGLEKLAVPEELILVGMSYGAFLVQVYAARWPEHVTAVVLVDPNNVPFNDAVGGLAGLGQPRPERGRLSAKLWEALTRQYDSYGATLERMRKTHLSPDMPVTVITAGKPWWPTPELNAAWRKSHCQMVEAGRHREWIMAEQSGHNIPSEQPQVVVDAVSRLIKLARGG